MEVENYTESLNAPAILAALLDEFSMVTDYRTLRDTLPQRLAGLLRCRCVLLYQRVDETLHFASGSFADQPGWSSTLLAVAHINPIDLHGELPEAQAWRARRAIAPETDGIERTLVCTPLIYRQRAIGVLTALRGSSNGASETCWALEEIPLVAVAANVVAMLLENTRLLERDQERIHELSLLNGIASQMNCTLRERSRVQRIVVQRAKEIAAADLCEVVTPETQADEIAWLPSSVHRELLQHWQHEQHDTPLILERAGETLAGDYLSYLEERIKTFFVVPLVGNREKQRMRVSGDEAGSQVSGVIVGAYYKPWKLRHEELVLLQVLANQASAVLENIALVEDVIEARNEARRLLRQVVDDQRIKELILESIPSGLLTLNMQGQITTFNRAAQTVLGYHSLEILGQPVRKILDLRGLESVLQSGQTCQEKLLTTGRQGQPISLDITLVPLRDDRGSQIGILATFADVTSVHHLEEEKRRLDRLASLGEMSASVAHEVRNPLASIKTSMQMMLGDLESDGALQADQGAREAVEVVLHEVERLDSIVRDLLLFARPRRLHLIQYNLLTLSERLLHFLQPRFEEAGVRVHLTRQEIPTVQIDVSQIEQVLLNLFLNALQAMPDGGILSVSCQIVHLSGAGEQQEQRSMIELSVSDTGEGIAQDELERIFQPFYTTKAHGIGLGLPITRRLIEDHHGSILVESQLGYGTTVSVRLPLSEK